ncbi:hypothetical protein [Nesterenkonia jeotgali]|uniref:Uncharacterized protein n=1 Tax=Nesterenkonia jeotgali TaxID=317018 RepID=A0A839FUI8_9MICC|nr:hypothetical protein [Nesterenkonia jeotgali]MBA8920447.1 hypothetical protein [Nesterenkonia jeotgali]
MPFVGPFQQYVIDEDRNVARVDDWAMQAAAITSGIEQGKAEALAAARVDAAHKAAATLAASKQFTTDSMNTSHLDLDTDGTPYFRLGSMTLSIHADTDGNPFFLDN